VQTNPALIPEKSEKIFSEKRIIPENQSSPLGLDTEDLSSTSTSLKEETPPSSSPSSPSSAIGLDTEDLSPSTTPSKKEEISPPQKNKDQNHTEDLTLEIKSTHPLPPSDPNQTSDLTLHSHQKALSIPLEERLLYPSLTYSHNEKEESFFLKKNKITCGRSSNNDLPLNFSSLSRTHCLFFKKGKKWFIEDQGSFNGTFVGSQRILSHQPLSLEEDTLLRVGEISLFFRLPLFDKAPEPLPVSPFLRLCRILPGFSLSILFHTLLFYIIAHIFILERSEEVSKPLFVSALEEPEPLEKPWQEPEKQVEESRILEPETSEIKEEVLKEVIEEPEIPYEEFSEEIENNFSSQHDLFSSSDFQFSTTLPPVTGIGSSGDLSKLGKLGSRFGNKKKQLLKGNGGGLATERAVENGLKWLARHQSPQGFWDSSSFTGQCDQTPICRGVVGTSHKEAITAFCLLAFLGAGHSEDFGTYKNIVKKAIRYLEGQQNADGSFGGSFNTMYTHAIVTLALCEALQFRRGTYVPTPHPQRGLDYLINAQHNEGGWRYGPKQPGDTSVTGWCIMALKAGRDANLTVPLTSFEKAKKFIDSVTDDRYYQAGYVNSSSTTLTMTSVAVSCRYFLGENKSPQISGGVDAILSQLPEKSAVMNYYYWYYGTLSLFQYGGKPWNKWNTALKEILLPLQQEDGCEKGSWDPVCGYFGQSGGRVLNTAIAVLILEVYYRYPRAFK
jgi:pSer/pThr/pTyr-binding forkhead associated (FHA) protein